MVETTAVVLLFDDAELGGQLREALQERGANIVHEGGLSDLSRELFVRVDADVVVISFGDDDDDAFALMDKAIAGDRPRVVINDALASRGLEGWDRARWARHLAAKVLAAGDIDPPRPAQAPAPPIETVDEMVSAADTAGSATVAGATDADVRDENPVDAGDQHDREIAAESDSLEAELEALLAGDPLPSDDEVGSGLNYAIGEAPSQLHDGNFLDAVGAGTSGDDLDEELERLLAGDEPLDRPAQEPVSGEPKPQAPKFSLDSLSLVDMDAAGPPPLPDAAGAANAAVRTAAPVAPTHQAPDTWSLVDPDGSADGAADAEAEEPVSIKADPAEFGIEKLSASDFLAPDGDRVDADYEPKMTLELVSMEAAVAPQPFEAAGHEMLLDSLGSALTRLVLLGATVDSTDSVCDFLAMLPAKMRATIVHVQHLGSRSTDELVQHLARHSALPVRVAQNGQLARAGELLVVPPECELRLSRDGKVDLRPAQDMGASSPSIDTTFTAAASSFGRDALAILFAGQANDAVAGCQAIHDRGGRVWVEDSSGEHFADMVSGVMAEQLADFSGAPAALAARLVEEY